MARTRKEANRKGITEQPPRPEGTQEGFGSPGDDRLSDVVRVDLSRADRELVDLFELKTRGA